MYYTDCNILEQRIPGVFWEPLRNTGHELQEKGDLKLWKGNPT